MRRPEDSAPRATSAYHVCPLRCGTSRCRSSRDTIPFRMVQKWYVLAFFVQLQCEDLTFSSNRLDMAAFWLKRSIFLHEASKFGTSSALRPTFVLVSAPEEAKFVRAERQNRPISHATYRLSAVLVGLVHVAMIGRRRLLTFCISLAVAPTDFFNTYSSKRRF